jgi:hypothetical protein
MKKLLVTIWLVLLFSAVGALFWYNELVYHLPTPIPKNYKPVGVGTIVKLGGIMDGDHSKPIFLHFFNPDCPCSKFNTANFKALVKQYSGQVNFLVVAVSNKTYTAKNVQDKLGVDIPVLFDGALPAACGVYSTPQAVLLDPEHKLYYRGNYNQSRYCTNETTSYAKIALNAILHNHARPYFSALALRAYGCGLPGCRK